MQIKYYITIILIFFIVKYSAFSQVKDTIKGNIYVLEKVENNKVSLRWAPDNYILWEYLNKTGYKIERRKLSPAGKPITKADRVLLTPIPLFPMKEEDFSNIDPGNDYLSLAKEFYYNYPTNATGDGFNAAIKSESLKKERYSFILLSADNSFAAANALALGFEDNTFEKGSKYVYMVFPAVISDTVKVDTAKIFVNTEELSRWPAPNGINAVFGDRKATISWNKKELRQYYNNYWVERSDDGGRIYQKLNNSPLVSMWQQGSQIPKDYVVYIDSLPKNEYEYFYRIRGINSFGDVSDASKPIKGMGAIELIIPHLAKPVVVNNQLIYLNWAFPDSLRPFVKGFQIKHSSSPEGPFVKLNEKLLQQGANNYSLTAKSSTNYFIVSAIRAADGKEYDSYPEFTQLIDTIAPNVPKGLSGKIDSTGNVLLKWNANTEDDLFGYRVYYSNSLNDEFTQITDSAILAPEFSFVVPLNTLTNNLFCKIQAEDSHFNGSKFSEIIELQKPDTIRPTCPVFRKVYSTDSSVFLIWIGSSSEDVAAHNLYRKAKDSTSFLLIKQFNNRSEEYTYSDYSAEMGTVYEYKVTAIDKSKNESTPSPSFKAMRLRSNDKIPLKIAAKTNREEKQITLAWEVPKKKVNRYIVYKANENAPLKMFCTLPGEQTLYVDNKLVINTSYLYKVKAEHIDGTEKVSEILKVDY